MLKLTATNIEEIRSYFLATSEEEQLTIQKNIIPSYLSDFLPPLKQLFNEAVADEIELESIAKSIGAEDHLEALKEIRQDYYSHLAQQYDYGISNPDIELLIKVQNKDFLREVEFQKELKAAFKLNERAALKNTFKDLDKTSEINNEELSEAFKLIERQKLKDQFQKFEEENTSTKRHAAVIKFKWRPFAIAASIVGFLALAGYIFILVEGRQENIRVANNRENQLSLFGIGNNLTDTGSIYEIKEQRQIGFTSTQKVDSIKVIVRDVSAMAGLIDFKISFLINKFDSSAAKPPSVKNNHNDLDSLKSIKEYLHIISDTYSYNVETRTITLNVSSNDSLISVYRYSATGEQPDIYIKFNSLFYKIDRGITPMPLKEIGDRNLIEILQRI